MRDIFGTAIKAHGPLREGVGLTKASGGLSVGAKNKSGGSLGASPGIIMASQRFVVEPERVRHKNQQTIK